MYGGSIYQGDTTDLLTTVRMSVESFRMLIGMQDITEIVETVLYTSRVTSPHVCSVLLVSPSGSGKSGTLMQFQKFPYSYFHGDLTTMRMADILEQDKDGKIRHFIMPDLNPSLSHKGSVVNLFLASLLTLQSEGMFESGDGRKTKTVRHAPVGMVTACTPEMYDQYHKKMRILGLIRRNAPLFYTLSDQIIDKAQEEKKNGVIHRPDERKMRLGKLVDPKISSIHADLIHAYSDTFANNLSIGPVWHVEANGARICRPGKVETLLPLAPHDFLRTMAKAHAVRAGRFKVNGKDVEFIRKFVSLTRYGEVKQL